MKKNSYKTFVKKFRRSNVRNSMQKFSAFICHVICILYFSIQINENKCGNLIFFLYILVRNVYNNKFTFLMRQFIYVRRRS